MAGQTESPPRSVIPTSLASFISIARSDLRHPAERRLVNGMTGTAGVMVFLAAFPTPYRVHFLVCGGFLLAMLGLNSFLQINAMAETSGQVTLRHLFRFLNYNRAKVGLQEVIGTEMLSVLEGEAKVWEQIEAGLQNEQWSSQESLKDRIQSQADRAMMELIALGTSSGSNESYDSWHAGWDTNVNKLRDLLRAMHQAERILFGYPRATDLSAEAPAPETSEIEELERILAD